MPEPGRWEAEAFVAAHLDDLLDRRRSDTESRSSDVYRGGQRAADRALGGLVVDGYRAGRDQAYPLPRRTVTGLSPWIRHGLLTLPVVWRAVERRAASGTGTALDDRDTLADALLRQEYARHWYARLGARTRHLAPAPTPSPTHPAPAPAPPAPAGSGAAGDWDRRMGCVELALDELEEDGWLAGRARSWLAAHWAVRDQRPWSAGEDHFHRHLLDGSRAANRLGWLTAAGGAGTPPFDFSRWDVEEKAPGLCATCELVHRCPVEQRLDRPAAGPADEPLLHHDPDVARTAGPPEAVTVDGAGRRPEVVWLTAESLGDADPALAAHPDLPAVFVFDEPLLRRLRLSSKRLVFLTETLAELAAGRPVELWRGDPVTVLAGRSVAATFTPVPGWRTRAASIEPAVIHPWPWLRRPHDSRIDSYPSWLDGFASTMPPGAPGRARRTAQRLV